METKKCKQCQSDISNKAKRCPNCKADQRAWLNRHPIIVLGLLFLVFVVFSVGISSNNESVVTPVTPIAPTPSVSTQSALSKAEAQKKLNDTMKLAETANLVTSYEFSDSASVVYAGPVWYTQSVTFKKDFMATVAMLKKSITGYAHFEVRDANSNEKVGEVTAFSGSLEVYK